MTENSNRRDFTRRENFTEPAKRMNKPSSCHKTDHLCRLSSIRPSRLSCGSRKHGKKSAAIFPESDNHGAVEENHLPTESEYSRLCSGTKSTTFVDNDSFTLSLSDEGTRIFDGSSINPVEEASLVLEKASNGMGLQEDLKEEKVLTWLLNSSIDNSKCSNTRFSEKTEWDAFQSDFPSPSFNIACNINRVFPCEDVSEVDDLDDIDANEPLFWPSDCKTSWGSDLSSWDHFPVSPRRDVTETSEICRTPKTVKLGLHERRKDCKGKLFERRPSRLSIPGQDSVEQIGIDRDDEVKEVHTDALVADDSRFLLEDDFGFTEELAIESLVGLNEFNGHEGVDAKFGEDDFSLDEFIIDDNMNTLSL